MTTTKPSEAKIGFIDESGRFHCPCGATHGRGPINGVDVYRCLHCGTCYQVRGVVQLRAGETSR